MELLINSSFSFFRFYEIFAKLFVNDWEANILRKHCCGNNLEKCWKEMWRRIEYRLNRRDSCGGFNRNSPELVMMETRMKFHNQILRQNWIVSGVLQKLPICDNIKILSWWKNSDFYKLIDAEPIGESCYIFPKTCKVEIPAIKEIGSSASSEVVEMSADFNNS